MHQGLAPRDPALSHLRQRLIPPPYTRVAAEKSPRPEQHWHTHLFARLMAMPHRALRTTPVQVFQADSVVNEGEASSEITLAQSSSAEHDEKHRRADGRASIVRGKGFGPHLKTQEKLAAESGQRHQRKEGFGRERERPAIREEHGFVSCYRGGVACVGAERGVCPLVIMVRRMARTGYRRSHGKDDNPDVPPGGIQ